MSSPQRRRVQLIKNKQISQMHETGAKKETEGEGKMERGRANRKRGETVNEQCGTEALQQLLDNRLDTGDSRQAARQAGDKSCRSKRFLMQRSDFFFFF